MQWTIDEKKLTGPIDFNSGIEDVKVLLGEPTSQFKRTSDSDEVTFAYDLTGIHLNLDSKGRISQLTVFPENEVFIGTIQLIKKPIDAIYAKLSAIGILVNREDAGLWCESKNVFLVDVDGMVDGVEIYHKKQWGSS